MSVDPSLLASQIATALGHPGDVTIQVMGFAKGVLEELTQNGHAAVGSPSDNPISGMSNSSMASKIAGYAGYPNVTTELSQFCLGIVTHIEAAGIVSYTGPTPPAPVVYFLGGTISGLAGATMASLVASDVGYPNVSTQLSAMCTAICNHIVTNAQVVSGVIS